MNWTRERADGPINISDIYEGDKIAYLYTPNGGKSWAGPSGRRLFGWSAMPCVVEPHGEKMMRGSNSPLTILAGLIIIYVIKTKEG